MKWNANATGSGLCGREMSAQQIAKVLCSQLFKGKMSFVLRCSTKKECTTCSRTNYKIVPITNLNKYLYNGKSEIEVNINNSSEKA
jgi:hypothetical protein